MLKVMTIVGTRPELIRLSRVIHRLDATVDHVLVHTGQNYDYSLNEVFFQDLGIRQPDHMLGVDTSSLGAVLGGTLIAAERVMMEEQPDAVLVLGDTNSCIAALMARRMQIPVYHMEAGNRCFDPNVPEETNRRLVDHVADFNLVYTEHARRNLLAEGLHPRRIIKTGSPMREVLDAYRDDITASDVLERPRAHRRRLLPCHRPPRGERRPPRPPASPARLPHGRPTPRMNCPSSSPHTRAPGSALRRCRSGTAPKASHSASHLAFHDYNRLQLVGCLLPVRLRNDRRGVDPARVSRRHSARLDRAPRGARHRRHPHDRARPR